MPTDLSDRASQKQIELEKGARAIADALAAARAEHDRRHPDPASVARPDWATAFGASQHRDVARAALAALRAEESRIRAALAAVTTAADAETFEDQLRALLVTDAGLRVDLRFAEERVASARAVIDADATLATAAHAEVAAAAARASWAEEHQTLGEALRAALTDEPLAGIVAAATALKAAAAYTGADARLDDLLPAELRARATARDHEAFDATTAAASQHDKARDARDGLDRAEAPRLAEVEVATRTFLEAESALRAYVEGAATELAVATSLLARVTAHPDLSAAQVAALDAAANPDGQTALGAEDDLATALADLSAAQQAVDDAILDALVADPDRDPETVQAVIDARAALDDPAVQDAVTDARAAYDAAAQAALDAWEAEVPSTLWDALADFLAATRALDRLGSNAARTALVTTLDTAQDDLATALDARDVAVRARWAAALVHAERGGRRAAADATGTDRRLQYVRGDGPSGRTATEL